MKLLHNDKTINVVRMIKSCSIAQKFNMPVSVIVHTSITQIARFILNINTLQNYATNTSVDI
jgi:hypothetical protein